VLYPYFKKDGISTKILLKNQCQKIVCLAVFSKHQQTKTHRTLSDHRKSIILKGAEAIPEVINRKKEENKLIEQSFISYRIYYISRKFTINRVSEIEQISHSTVYMEMKLHLISVPFIL